MDNVKELIGGAVDTWVNQQSRNDDDDKVVEYTKELLKAQLSQVEARQYLQDVFKNSSGAMRRYSLQAVDAFVNEKDAFDFAQYLQSALDETKPAQDNGDNGGGGGGPGGEVAPTQQGISLLVEAPAVSIIASVPDEKGDGVVETVFPYKFGSDLGQNATVANKWLAQALQNLKKYAEKQNAAATGVEKGERALKEKLESIGLGALSTGFKDANGLGESVANWWLDKSKENIKCDTENGGNHNVDNTDVFDVDNSDDTITSLQTENPQQEMMNKKSNFVNKMNFVNEFIDNYNTLVDDKTTRIRPSLYMSPGGLAFFSDATKKNEIYLTDKVGTALYTAFQTILRRLAEKCGPGQAVDFQDSGIRSASAENAPRLGAMLADRFIPLLFQVLTENTTSLVPKNFAMINQWASGSNAPFFFRYKDAAAGGGGDRNPSKVAVLNSDKLRTEGQVTYKDVRSDLRTVNFNDACFDTALDTYSSAAAYMGIGASLAAGRGVLMSAFGYSGVGKTSTLFDRDENTPGILTAILYGSIVPHEKLRVTFEPSEVYGLRLGNDIVTNTYYFDTSGRTKTKQANQTNITAKVNQRTALKQVRNYIRNKLDSNGIVDKARKNNKDFKGVNETKNNPESSRSIMVSKLTLEKDGENPTPLVVLDMPGREEIIDTHVHVLHTDEDGKTDWKGPNDLNYTLADGNKCTVPDLLCGMHIAATGIAAGNLKASDPLSQDRYSGLVANMKNEAENSKVLENKVLETTTFTVTYHGKELLQNDFISSEPISVFINKLEKNKEEVPMQQNPMGPKKSEFIDYEALVNGVKFALKRRLRYTNNELVLVAKEPDYTSMNETRNSSWSHDHTGKYIADKKFDPGLGSTVRNKEWHTDAGHKLRNVIKLGDDTLITSKRPPASDPYLQLTVKVPLENTPFLNKKAKKNQTKGVADWKYGLYDESITEIIKLDDEKKYVDKHVYVSLKRPIKTSGEPIEFVKEQVKKAMQAMRTGTLETEADVADAIIKLINDCYEFRGVPSFEGPMVLRQIIGVMEGLFINGTLSEIFETQNDAIRRAENSQISEVEKNESKKFQASSNPVLNHFTGEGISEIVNYFVFANRVYMDGDDLRASKTKTFELQLKMLSDNMSDYELAGITYNGNASGWRVSSKGLLRSRKLSDGFGETEGS